MLSRSPNVAHEVAWQQAHGFPFEFSTEASINIADDGVLLRLMRECGFFTIFVGIESPDPDTLKQAVATVIEAVSS